MKPHNGREGEEEGPHVEKADAASPDGDHLPGEELGKGVKPGADSGVDKVLEEHGAPHGADHEVQGGSLPPAEARIGEPFVENGDDPRARDASREDEAESQAELRRQGKPHVGAEHDDRSVGEVAEVEHAEDEGVAHRHQGVDASYGEARYQCLKEQSGPHIL